MRVYSPSWLTAVARRFRPDAAASPGGIAGSLRGWVRRVPVLVRVLLVLTIIPIVEYAFLVWISQQIGFTLTLAYVLATGVIGAWMVRQQGLEAWGRILDCVRRGEPFGDAMFDGALIVLAGVLLIAPGVLSDVVGFALLVPRLRGWIKQKLAGWLRARALTHAQAFQASATVIDITNRASGDRTQEPGETTRDAAAS